MVKKHSGESGPYEDASPAPTSVVNSESSASAPVDEENAETGTTRIVLDDPYHTHSSSLTPPGQRKSLLQLMWLALKDKVLIMLSITAVISFVLGLFQDFGTPRNLSEPPVDWVEGLAIMVAILIVVVVGSLKNWQNEPLRGVADNTSLQYKVNNLAEVIAKIGSLAGFLLFCSLMIRFFVRLVLDDPRAPIQNGIGFVNILLISLTLIVVAVPKGLPLIVTLAVAFFTKGMTRDVNDAVRKYLQFQMSTIVAAICITFVTAVCSKEGTSALSAVQLLWVSIIMDPFASFALATDPANDALLVGNHRQLEQTVSLFSVDMYKQILFQSMYQIVVVLIIHFLGGRVLGIDTHTGDAGIDKHNAAILQTLAFNIFVFAQIFNSVNCRRLDRRFNVLEGITRNKYFVAITLIELVVQTLIVFVGGTAFQVTALGGREWGISIASGFLCIPLGALVRLMPSKHFEWAFEHIGILGRDEVLPTARPEASSSLESNSPNTPSFNSKLLHLVKLFLRLFLFAVPGAQYAKASNIRSSDLSTLQDSDVISLIENFRNTCFEELKLIVAVATFLSAAILGQMLYRPHILSITSFLSIAAASSMVTIVQSLVLWHSFSYLVSVSAARHWVQNVQNSPPFALDPWIILSLPMVGLHWGLVAFIVANVILIWTDPDGAATPPPTPSNLSRTITRIAISFIMTLGGVLAVFTRSAWRGYMTTTPAS